MKKQKYLLLIMCILCTLLFGACSQESSDDDRDDRVSERSEDDDDDDDDDDKDKDKDDDKDSKKDDDDETGSEEDKSDDDDDEPEISDEAARLTSYSWQGTNDNSLLVFEQDGTFRYYQSADNLTDNYFEGTYGFYVGADAVEYITTELSDFSVTEDELKRIFDNSDDYDESNFVCFYLNNEACYMGGENTVDKPYLTPYFGFCLEDDEDMYLDIANMNTANYYMFMAK